MEYLFVGGPYHGRMIKVSDAPFGPIYAPVMPEKIAFRYNPIEMKDWPVIERATYYRRDIGTDHIVYVCTKITA